MKDEETVRLFTHEMAARNNEVTKADNIQKKWLLMKEIWLKGSKQVCGMTKGPPRHKETWWWNRGVEKVVAKRKVCHKAWRKSKSAEDKHTLDVAKKEGYTAVMTAQESKLQEFTADLQSESGGKNCFRIARQMAREGRYVISVFCMKNDAGNVVSDANGMKNIWRKYMEKLLNVENDWDGEVDCPEVMRPHCLISEEGAAAIKGLKIGKAAGPTGVVSEMMKAHLTRTPHQHCRHPRTLILSQHTHMQHQQRYMHHSHRNNRTHNIGYYDNLTNRPRTITGLLTPHKHTGPAVKVRENINGLKKQTRGAQTAYSRHTCRHHHNSGNQAHP